MPCTSFADHFVPSERLEALSEALAFRADPTGPSEIVLLFDEDARAHAASGIAGVDRRGVLRADRDRDRRSTAGSGDHGCRRHGRPPEGLAPTGLTVTLDAVREAREMSGLRAALEGEYRRVLWFVNEHPDLVEGIRAQLVDKDRNPKWDPPTLAELAPDAGAPARDYVPQPALF